MPVTDAQRKVVEQVFQAMHEGLKGEDRMMTLFADQANVTEPFSGQPVTHRGKEAIRAWFKQAMATMPPDVNLKMDRIDLDGDCVKADWTCTSPVFPTPMKGYDKYLIRDGKIHEAEFVVTEMPPMDQG
jgi:hypothetical protein